MRYIIIRLSLFSIFHVFIPKSVWKIIMKKASFPKQFKNIFKKQTNRKINKYIFI